MGSHTARRSISVMLRTAAILACVAAMPAASALAAPDSSPARALAIAAQMPRLQSDFAAAPLAAPEKEGPLARECYRRIEAYLPYINANLKNWDAEPGARYHKRDGAHELDVRQNATVALGLAVYAAYSRDQNKPAVRQALADAKALVRYLSVTHKANFLPTGGGAPWGGHWQSAHWTASAGNAAWHIWDNLDDETRLMAARMIEHEADRFNQRPPDDGEWADTKAEENGWNSQIMSLACSMFPRHPRAALWRERAIVYMMNSFSTRADHSDDTIVDGRRVRDWVTTVCIHDDYTLENHRRVHPDYMGTISLVLRNALFFRLAGQPVPGAACHHVKDCFTVLQQLTSPDGAYFYVNGQDWWPHRHDGPLIVGGLMATVLADPAGAFMEARALDSFRKMHSRFKDGRACNPNEYNYANVEEEMIARYGELYLAHRLHGNGPRPLSLSAFSEANAGSRLFDAGGFVIHRSPDSFCSFAWVNGAMGLIYPGGDTWFTSPDTRSMTGSISAAGAKDTAPQLIEKSVRLLPGKDGKKTQGFAFAGRFNRLEGKARQDLAYIALPGGTALYIEQWMALQDLSVSSVTTGSFAVMNENASPIVPNRRAFRTASGSITVKGESDDPAKRQVWETPWVTIDGRLAVITEAGARMAFDERHKYERSRLDQMLSPIFREGVGAKKAGEVFASGAAAFVPNPKRFKGTALEVRRQAGGVVAVRFGGGVAIVNFGAQSAAVDAFGVRARLSPLEILIESH